jgi:hypothetical protein
MGDPHDEMPPPKVTKLRPVDHAIADAIMGVDWKGRAEAAEAQNAAKDEVIAAWQHIAGVEREEAGLLRAARDALLKAVEPFVHVLRYADCPSYAAQLERVLARYRVGGSESLPSPQQGD